MNNDTAWFWLALTMLLVFAIAILLSVTGTLGQTVSDPASCSGAAAIAAA
jgi:hypothetical protein